MNDDFKNDSFFPDSVVTRPFSCVLSESVLGGSQL
jgi:hypothetical protein